MADADDAAMMRRELDPATARMPEDEKIRFFTGVYTRCGAEAACRRAIDDYQQRAIDLIAGLTIDPKRTYGLASLAQSMTNRKI